MDGLNDVCDDATLIFILSWVSGQINLTLYKITCIVCYISNGCKKYFCFNTCNGGKVTTYSEKPAIQSNNTSVERWSIFCF